MKAVEKRGYPYPEELRNGQIETIARQYLQLHYRLLSYNYTLAWQTHTTGIPSMRAILEGEFLVAPVYRKGTTQRSSYLPEGIWYHVWVNEIKTGGENTFKVDLAKLSLYGRAGTINPFELIRQYTVQKVTEAITLKIYKGADGDYIQYDDDGIGLDYPDGKSTLTPTLDR